ncbi:MAG: Putrescine transport system permease protein PotH [Alphaproteobacteria bacterium MarineAlpha4_Bin2]|nr:MAG: Putrescine transport system permease protein PotH [Alphaproteobacteria bacterium MarineAlpha4_Bin2]
MNDAAQQESDVLVTADGTPLKVSLARAMRRQKIRAVLLVAPLFLFIVITFFIPIVDMLFRSVENSIVIKVLPRSTALLANWDANGNKLPSEAVFAAMVEDIKEGRKNRTITRVGQRLNYEQPGMSSLFRSSGRKAKRITQAPYKPALIKTNPKWGDIETWKLIKQFSPAYTPGYFLAAIDAKQNPDGELVRVEEEVRIYIDLFGRTLKLSIIITIITLILGFPIAYLMAMLPTRTSNLLLILVLLPFWTSLLVRTTAWIALLQQQGVINEFLVFAGLVDTDNRPQMIHNQFGSIVAMTHILLPFMVLPLFSVMKTIPKSYARAAVSLGAHPWTAFWKVYFPNTVPGIGAGAILVFILAIGYYITPELVGGTEGTFISNRIAYHISGSLNWGLGAALGVILLGVVIALYLLYDKIVGIDNMKLG